MLMGGMQGPEQMPLEGSPMNTVSPMGQVNYAG